jgi:hypothetical protein
MIANREKEEWNLAYFSRINDNQSHADPNLEELAQSLRKAEFNSRKVDETCSVGIFALDVNLNLNQDFEFNQ